MLNVSGAESSLSQLLARTTVGQLSPDATRTDFDPSWVLPIKMATSAKSMQKPNARLPK
jgi:hypothetical protein